MTPSLDIRTLAIKNLSCRVRVRNSWNLQGFIYRDLKIMTYYVIIATLEVITVLYCIVFLWLTWWPLLLRSAVGKTHVLRSRLVMDYTTSYFPLSLLECPLDSKLDSTFCPGALVFPPTYGSTWVVLWLLSFRSPPSTFPNKRSTLKGPFRGVPSRKIILRNRPYPSWHWSLVCQPPITLGWLPHLPSSLTQTFFHFT